MISTQKLRIKGLSRLAMKPTDPHGEILGNCSMKQESLMLKACSQHQYIQSRKVGTLDIIIHLESCYSRRFRLPTLMDKQP